MRMKRLELAGPCGRRSEARSKSQADLGVYLCALYIVKHCNNVASCSLELPKAECHCADSERSDKGLNESYVE
jgi:hypothetical protein